MDSAIFWGPTGASELADHKSMPITLRHVSLAALAERKARRVEISLSA